MGLMVKKLLGINIIVSQKVNILENIRKYLKSNDREQRTNNREKEKPFIIFTPNPEIINCAQKDIHFKSIVNSAQINIPDGAGVVWGIEKKYRQKIEKISGADFMGDLCKMSADYGFTVGLIGGRGGVALEALECLRRSYNNLSGWATDGPEIEIQNSKIKMQNYKSKKAIKTPRRWQADPELVEGEAMTPPMVEELEDRYFLSLVKEIMKRKIDILFVGLGCPKQEYFINRIKYQVLSIKYDKPLVLMGVGGSFDYISGRIPRAPYWMREKGWEWLYRLIREPWRLPRQIRGAEFFIRMLTER